MTDHIETVLTDAIQAWPNHPWLVLPGPTDLAPGLAAHLVAALKAARIAVVELPEPSESDCCGAAWYPHGTTVEFLTEGESYVTDAEGGLWTVDDARSLAAEFWAAADAAEASQ